MRTADEILNDCFGRSGLMDRITQNIEERHKCGQSYRNIAERVVGISPPALMQFLENGKNQKVKINTLIKYAKILGVK